MAERLLNCESTYWQKFSHGAAVYEVISGWIFCLRGTIQMRNVKISSMNSTKATSTANRGGLFRSLRLRTCGQRQLAVNSSSVPSNQRKNSFVTIPTIVGATTNVKICRSMNSTPFRGKLPLLNIAYLPLNVIQNSFKRIIPLRCLTLFYMPLGMQGLPCTNEVSFVSSATAESCPQRIRLTTAKCDSSFCKRSLATIFPYIVFV